MEERAKSGAVAAAAGDLPDDAVLEILSRVPARSINRFKCVSKPWRDLIADPVHRKRLPQTLEGFFLSNGPSVGAVAGFGWSFISLPGRSAPLADPSLSFLAKLPGIWTMIFSSCNGLLLFENLWNPDTAYVVCNPATEEWVAVPSSGCPCPNPLREERTDLIFDPAVSPHFNLVHICQALCMGKVEVHTYSSETRVWSDRTSPMSQCQDEGRLEQWVNGGAMWTSNLGSAFVNGMLHLVVFCVEEYWMSVVDRQGKICRIIPLLDKRSIPFFVGQSQGHLHCVARLEEQERNCLKSVGLSIWVLEDYDTEEWVLKHRVSFLELFGQMSCHYGHLDVVAIHPDRNLIFIAQKSFLDQKLISYDMDNKESHAFHTLWHDLGSLTPYVPNFMELVATNGH